MLDTVGTMEKENPLIHIFWTGGWDSTYRMIELSRMPVTVEPIYILDEGRSSNQREMDAIATITELLKKRPETRATILPVINIKVSEIPENPEISAAAKQLAQEFGLGIQHDWTARVAEHYPMVEMCIEKVTRGYMPTRMYIAKYGALKESWHGYIVDQEKSQDLLKLILGNITLPIFETTETDMLNNVKEWGYEDIMQHIWFCHLPIDGKPCGFCSPCHTKMNSDMEFLLPEEGRKRFEKSMMLEKRFGKYVAKAYKFAARKFKVV